MRPDPCPSRHAVCTWRRVNPNLEGPMATDNISIVKRVIDEVWNQGKLDVLPQLVSPQIVGSDSLAGDLKGMDGFERHIKAMRTAFPDLRLRTDDILNVGDRVIVRWTATGTNRGTLAGIPATNKQGTVHGMTLNTIRDGKLVEMHASWDTLSMIQQLGLVPSMEKLAQGNMGTARA